MNSAEYVDSLIADLKIQVQKGLIILSQACWLVALACVGWSYVYSAWEALCTPSERRYRFRLCPDKTSIKAKCKGFDSGNCDGCQWYPNNERTRCGDCRGFVKWIIQMITGFELYGDTVSAQWNHKNNWCVKGQIGVDPIPQNVLVNIFIKNKNGKWTHTGFYYNGSTCECSSGVQYFEKMKSNRWTHWAIAACFASNYEKPKEPPKEQEKPMDDIKNLPTLRKGSKGEYVTLLQTKLANLGYNLGKSGIDGDFGSATLAAVKAFQKDRGLSVDGVVGKKTWEALMNVAEPQKLYTVTIKGKTKTVADEIISKYGGTMTAE